MNNASFDPDWFSKPGDTLAEIMQRSCLSQRELADRLRSQPETISGILTGRVPIDDKLASKLTDAVGGSQNFWLKRQAVYDAALARAAASIEDEIANEWVREFSAKALAACGLKRRGIEKAEVLKSFLAYFGVSSLEDWRKRYASFPGDVAFKNSTAYETLKSSLAVWLRQGEIEALNVPTAKWDPGKLKDAIPELRQLTKLKSPSSFVPRLRGACARAGVAVVFVRAPQGCRASGASRFISPDKAMIILSFRHRVDDQLWFTVFHEIAHLILHSQEQTFVDQDDMEASEREVEANAFAASALVPMEAHEEMLSLRPQMKAVIRFAVKVGVSPGIVVGQMQHGAALPPDKLNFLKRRYDWDEISAAFT